MRVLTVQVLMSVLMLLLTGCSAHLLPGALDGSACIYRYLGGEPNFYRRPFSPHPLPLPPPPPHHTFIPQPQPQPPVLYRVPQQVIIVRGVFPPFIERIVQRIQTYYSVYNNPGQLNPPPAADPPATSATTRPPKKKVTTTTTAPRTTTTEETEDPTTTTPPPTVSTLAVFEVTPSPAPEDPPPTTTPADPETDTDTEEPVYITPEKASLLGQKDAFLRFLQTGKVPPYLEADTLNDMEDVFS